MRLDMLLFYYAETRLSVLSLDGFYMQCTEPEFLKFIGACSTVVEKNREKLLVLQFSGSNDLDSLLHSWGHGALRAGYKRICVPRLAIRPQTSGDEILDFRFETEPEGFDHVTMIMGKRFIQRLYELLEGAKLEEDHHCTIMPQDIVDGSTSRPRRLVREAHLELLLITGHDVTN